MPSATAAELATPACQNAPDDEHDDAPDNKHDNAPDDEPDDNPSNEPDDYLMMCQMINLTTHLTMHLTAS